MQTVTLDTITNRHIREYSGQGVSITSNDCHFPRASLTKPTTRTLPSTHHLASLAIDLHLPSPSNAGLPHIPNTNLRSGLGLASCLT